MGVDCIQLDGSTAAATWLHPDGADLLVELAGLVDPGFELSVIAAVVLGGTRLSGGEGTVSGTVLGVLILGVLNNGLVLLDVNTFWQEVVRGTVIILAVAVDEFRKRRRGRGSTAPPPG